MDRIIAFWGVSCMNKIISLGILGFVALCCGIAIIASAPDDPQTEAQSGGQSGETTSTDAGEAQPAPTEAPEPTYGVNQDVRVGDVRWKILEANDLGSELVSDNQFIDSVPTTGKFVGVRFEIENLSNDQLNFTDVGLIDSAGREFTPKDDVYFWIDDNEKCIYEQLNVNVPKVCSVIFEIPADAADLHLQVGDLELFGSDEALIALGL